MLALMLKGKMGQTANQYPGPVSSQINPLMLGAANMMSNYAGQGPYQMPGYNTYGTFLPPVQGGSPGTPQSGNITGPFPGGGNWLQDPNRRQRT